MDNLEKILNNLPKPKLNFWAGLKIKTKIYFHLAWRHFNIFPGALTPKKLIFSRAFAALLIIFVIFSGTSLYAYSDNNVTIGHALYPIKRIMESAEQTISYTDSLKASTYQKFSQRRLEEALSLSAENLKNSRSAVKNRTSLDIQKNINEAVNNISSAINSANDIKNTTEANNVKNNINNSETSVLQYLNKIKENADTDNDGDLIEKINEAEETINKYKGIIGSQEESSPTRENNLNKIKSGNKPVEINRVKKSPEKSQPEKKVQGIKITGEKTEPKNPVSKSTVNLNTNNSAEPEKNIPPVTPSESAPAPATKPTPTKTPAAENQTIIKTESSDGESSNKQPTQTKQTDTEHSTSGGQSREGHT